MRVRESIPSSMWLKNLQQSDTDLLASIKQEDGDPTDEITQVVRDPLEEPRAPLLKRPTLEPEPTAINPFPKDDHDDDVDPGSVSPQPGVQPDQSSRKVEGQVSEQ